MKKFFFVVGILCLFVGVFLAWFVPSAWFEKPPANAPSLAIVIEPNATVRTVADLLAQKGLIASAAGYRIYSYIDASAKRPKAGSYTVMAGQSYRAYARTFAFGPEREEISVTIPEGWSLNDEGDAVTKLGAIWKTPVVDDWRDTYPFLVDFKKGTTLEGYLFPDTYRVWKDQLPEGLIKKQLDSFATRAPRIAEEARKQGRTLQDVVTLASIVEKEVAKPEDRKIVAGIFWNRLQSGMPLQSDATVNYVTHGGRARPTAQDLAAESAYNTYKHRGLPPGPISNPGADALEAALFPVKTSYVYFLTDDQGKTYFAKTLDEHIRNRYAAYGE